MCLMLLFDVDVTSDTVICGERLLIFDDRLDGCLKS